MHIVSNMESVERILQYINVEKEGTETSINRKELVKQWPYFGRITFTNVCLRYTQEGSPVLKNLNFVIKEGEKVKLDLIKINLFFIITFAK